MMSIRTWNKVNFWIYLLNHTSLIHQTWPTDRHKQGQYFSEIYLKIWRSGAKFQALFNLATCSNYSTTDYIKFPVFHFLQRVNKEELSQVSTTKNWPSSLSCHFIKIIKGTGTSFQCPAVSQKHARRNVCYKIKNQEKYCIAINRKFECINVHSLRNSLCGQD